MTSHEQRAKAPPDAAAIVNQFRSPLVRSCRAILLPALKLVKFLRRVSWKTIGSEHFSEMEGPVIFASNHQSHADTHVITHTLPNHLRKTTAVAAAYDHFADLDGSSLKKRCIQFLVASLWHAFGIERNTSPLRSIRTMQELLLRGWSIVIYPEGTRSRSGDIATFKRGLAIIAKKSGRPIVPICVQGSRSVLPEATYIPRAGVIQISYGKPLHFREDESPAEFTERVETAVREMAGSA